MDIELARNLVINFFVKIATIILTALLGFIISNILGRFVNMIVHEFRVETLARKGGISIPLNRLLATSTEWSGYVITLLIVLRQIGIEDIVLRGVLILILIFLAASLLFGLHELIPNFFAGIIMRLKGMYKEGSKIHYKGVNGVIINRTFFDVRVKSESDEFSIPLILLLKRN